MLRLPARLLALSLLALSAPLAAPLLAPLLTSGPASAHEFTQGAITVEHPWTRATPPTAKVGGGFMAIVNAGDAPDRLLAVEAEIAARAELHVSTLENGVMQMRPLPDGIALPPGSTVLLEPGGLHVMFMELTAPLVEGQSFPAVLVFEQAGRVAVEFSVEALGSSHEGHGATQGGGS